ncbi:hypothetical protein ALC53_01643 [Atta colombica]|uniref:Uncharacterized protein n=1 Tax=Atta colombica TaxID=520822 RepID=A0A195BTG9_9HYME|nr:hypothetical protein ALC53_01643 [Atta colombica]
MLGRPSPELTSNLRLTPSLHVHPLPHPSPPLFLSMWLDLVENFRTYRFRIQEEVNRWLFNIEYVIAFNSWHVYEDYEESIIVIANVDLNLVKDNITLMLHEGWQHKVQLAIMPMFLLITFIIISRFRFRLSGNARTRFILIPGLSSRSYVFLTADEAEDEEAKTNREQDRENTKLFLK